MSDFLEKDKRESLSHRDLVQAQLSSTVASYRVQHISYTPQRVVVLMLAGGQEELESFGSEIEKEANSFFANNSITSIRLPLDGTLPMPDEIEEMIIGAVNNAAEAHSVENARKLIIVPLFIQGNYTDSQTDNYYQSYEEYTVSACEALKAREIEVFWLPAMIFFDKYITKRAEVEKRVIMSSQKISVGHVNAVLMLSDRDSRGFNIRRSVIVRNFVLTVLMFSSDGDRLCNSEIGNGKAFSSAAFPLQMPAHVEILKRVENILARFVGQPNDYEKCKKSFGKAISALPKDTVWRSGWKKLPLIDGDKISIAPILSFVGSEDSDIDTNRKRLSAFTNEYFISKLPIGKDAWKLSSTNFKEFMSAFWKLYKEKYGGSIYGISDIFEQGHTGEFINSCVDVLEIRDSYKALGLSEHISDYQNPVSEYVRNESSEVYELLSKRVRDFYSALLIESNSDTEKMLKAHKRASDFVMKLKSIVNDEMRYWQAEEIVHEYLAEEFTVTDDMLKELIDLYFNMLEYSENTTTAQQKFIEKVFELAKTNYRVNAATYLKNLEKNYKDEADARKIVKKCMEKAGVLLGRYNSTIEPEYQIILDIMDRSELAKTLYIDGDIKRQVRIVENINDCFYIVCWTKPTEIISGYKDGEV